MRVFKENQKFTKTWVLPLIIISLFVPFILIGKEWADKEDTSIVENLDLLATIGILIVCSFPIFLMNLKTRIDGYGVHYQFYPFHLSFRKISWQEINTIYVRKYDAISEYGGWGLKGGFFWKKNGIAYNVSGNVGIQIKLKSGKNILIGTKLKDKASQSIEYNFKHKNNE